MISISINLVSLYLASDLTEWYVSILNPLYPLYTCWDSNTPDVNCKKINLLIIEFV